MQNEILLKTIDTLPPLPATVIKLQQYIDDAKADVSVKKVVKIIQEDPLLTAELLRLANSPYYGFSHEISTIEQVVSLLGINNIKNIVLANSFRNVFKADVSPYGLDTDAFLANCAKESSFITDWLNKEDKKLSQMLVPSAMLLRLGVILFSNSLRSLDKDKDFLNMLKQYEFKNISMVEEEFCGVDSLSFLSFLFNHWRFSEALIEIIAYMTMPHSARDSVKKGAYALAIVNCLFEPHQGGSVFNMRRSLGLIDEAKTQGVHFDRDNFVAKVPQDMRKNMYKMEE